MSQPTQHEPIGIAGGMFIALTSTVIVVGAYLALLPLLDSDEVDVVLVLFRFPVILLTALWGIAMFGPLVALVDRHLVQREGLSAGIVIGITSSGVVLLPGHWLAASTANPAIVTVAITLIWGVVAGGLRVAIGSFFGRSADRPPRERDAP